MSTHADALVSAHRALAEAATRFVELYDSLNHYSRRFADAGDANGEGMADAAASFAGDYAHVAMLAAQACVDALAAGQEAEA